MKNLDKKVVEGFGDEWSRFDHSSISEKELKIIFDQYFHLFPKNFLSSKNIGFDLGCGSGRWAKFIAPQVKHLYCIDPSQRALNVARKNLSSYKNVTFCEASVGELPFADNSMDFGWSLGVLHHVPNTFLGLQACVSKLKEGGPFLIYLYYAFDNRPLWFQYLHKVSEIFRFTISRLPSPLRAFMCNIISLGIYWPLARIALFFEKIGVNVSNFPLSIYRNKSIYIIRTDALDRFGTSLEQRFTRLEIKKMMEDAGLANIQFNETEPYWCAVGYKKS